VIARSTANFVRSFRVSHFDSGDEPALPHFSYARQFAQSLQL
jgi:hypothetical protein